MSRRTGITRVASKDDKTRSVLDQRVCFARGSSFSPFFRWLIFGQILPLLGGLPGARR